MYTVLCVDDSTSNLLNLTAIFERFSHIYTVITANDSDEALEKLLFNDIDIILLDVMIPGLDGFETAKIINLNKKTQNTPILFLSEKTDSETIQNAFTYGVDYISEPYNEFELLKRVEFQLKLLDLNKSIKKEMLFNKSIINSTPDIAFIQGENEIINANDVFLHFFQVKSVLEFNKKYSCISELFMEYENFFTKCILNEDKSWVDKLPSNTSNETYKILIMNIHTFEPRIFQIRVTAIEKSKNSVVILSDITDLTLESKHFEIQATYDNLTNIYNRTKFNEMMDTYYSQFKAQKISLSFAIFDIDFFKTVNDQYGHNIGDETLITFAQTINVLVRKNDIFARWGGEEFTLLLPNTDIKKAYEVVENLRETISKQAFKIIGSKTCSVGVTQFKDTDTIGSVVIRADKALYEAKKKGRNKVCII